MPRWPIVPRGTLHNWSENSIKKSSICCTWKWSMKIPSYSIYITKFTSVLPKFWLRLKSINCLVHVSFYLTCSAINRWFPNHCVRRPFPKQPWGILPKKIFIELYNKCKGKWSCRRIILKFLKLHGPNRDGACFWTVLCERLAKATMSKNKLGIYI